MHAASFPLLSTVFIIIGLLFVALFVVHELGLTGRKDSTLKTLVAQIGISGLASVFLGVGTLFTLLSSGVYV